MAQFSLTSLEDKTAVKLSVNHRHDGLQQAEVHKFPVFCVFGATGHIFRDIYIFLVGSESSFKMLQRFFFFCFVFWVAAKYETIMYYEH